MIFGCALLLAYFTCNELPWELFFIISTPAAHLKYIKIKRIFPFDFVIFLLTYMTPIPGWSLSWLFGRVVPLLRGLLRIQSMSVRRSCPGRMLYKGDTLQKV